MGANDPQIQWAEDTAIALHNGETSETLVPQVAVDISASLSPFIIIFDDAGKPLASSGALDDKTPVPPSGVFEYAKSHGQNRLTWQPKSSVRVAAVITRYTGTTSGFVLAGRSLREIEKRESQLTFEVGLAWIASLIILLLMSGLFMHRSKDI
jgi:hypothetical protein